MKTFLLLPVLSAALLAGCATGPNTQGLGGGDYNRPQARKAQQVEVGVIESVRPVVIDGREPGYQDALAPAVGALAGGALGSTVGKGNGKRVAIVLGALGGGAAGGAFHKAASLVNGLEITVRIGDRLISITQADEGLGLRVGDRVRVLYDWQTYRVAPL